jgi:phenylacetate-CoA oxygenase PaaI subunit
VSEFLKDREADLETASAAPEAGDIETFSPAGRGAVLGLLMTLGDNKYKLGRRYSEWATSGPTLEASVAAASMTSDEMGHARSLYPLLRKFPEAPPELRREDDRTEFHNVSFLDTPFRHWTDLIAAAALFDRAMTVVIRAMEQSSFAPFRHRAKKILQEEQYHSLYADGWLETLAGDAGTRRPLKEAMNGFWTETLAWFGPEDDAVFTAAAREGILDADGAALRGRFVEEVYRAVEPIPGLSFPEDRPLPWNRWDAANRRLGA